MLTSFDNRSPQRIVFQSRPLFFIFRTCLSILEDILQADSDSRFWCGRIRDAITSDVEFSKNIAPLRRSCYMLFLRLSSVTRNAFSSSPGSCLVVSGPLLRCTQHFININLAGCCTAAETRRLVDMNAARCPTLEVRRVENLPVVRTVPMVG